MSRIPADMSQKVSWGNDAPHTPFDPDQRQRRIPHILLSHHHHHHFYIHSGPPGPAPALPIAREPVVPAPAPVPQVIHRTAGPTAPVAVPRVPLGTVRPLAPVPLVTRRTVNGPTRHPINTQPAPTVAPHRHTHRPTRVDSPVTIQPPSTHVRRKPSHRPAVANRQNYGEFTDPLSSGVLEGHHTLQDFTLGENPGRKAKAP
jgi:hypothetical protein